MTNTLNLHTSLLLNKLGSVRIETGNLGSVSGKSYYIVTEEERQRRLLDEIQAEKAYMEKLGPYESIRYREEQEEEQKKLAKKKEQEDQHRRDQFTHENNLRVEKDVFNML